MRTILILWFLIFSVIPLAFITGYSVVKYEEAINEEQLQRLEGNYREIISILAEFEADLISKITAHSQNSSLAYYLNSNQIHQIKFLARSWLQNTLAHKLSLYTREGRRVFNIYKDAQGEIKEGEMAPEADVFLSKEFLQQVLEQEVYRQIEVRSSSFIEIIAVSKVRNSSGRVVGYIEEVIELDQSFVDGLKNRMNLELVFFVDKLVESKDSDNSIFTSHEDLALYRPEDFVKEGENSTRNFFEIKIRDVPYGFILRSMKWGDHQLSLAIGTSKKAVRQVLRNVNYAFFTVVSGIVIFLIVLSFIISKILLRPVSSLVEAFQKVQPGQAIPRVENLPDNELGVLAENFNDLSLRVNKTQDELRYKIAELENANQEIRETQVKLVHTAKMASLGQLVAGVAHELNNPIGFIYGNMGHLRDYSQSLIKLIQAAEKSGVDLSEIKRELEYDYILEDMPKLIQSCEDGARRTRDIVIGLRNFSRLEEATLKEVDIHECLDNTLHLLSGELKNRIVVERHWGELPKIDGYPSQLNQVFMNILSNATQAIEGSGVITIITQLISDRIEIVIRDTGKGMDAETINKIFDPFFTTKTLGQGTGLGLSISFGIVQKHGGDILVKSEVGVGTEFTIYLPTNRSKA